MGIDKSTPWGEVVIFDDAIPSFDSEAALAAFLSTPSNDPISEVRLTAGDFVDMTGGRNSDPTRMRRYPCDILTFTLTGSRSRSGSTIGSIVVDHAEGWTRRKMYVASNLGRQSVYTFAQRSHPNDGRFEIVETKEALSVTARLELRHRWRLGEPIDHPSIHRRSATTLTLKGRRLRVSVDGRKMGLFESVEIGLRPDSLIVYV